MGNPETTRMCDCELSHNGLGMVGRRCDCDERKAAMEDQTAQPGTTHCCGLRSAARGYSCLECPDRPANAAPSESAEYQTTRGWLERLAIEYLISRGWIARLGARKQIYALFEPETHHDG